MVTKDGIISTVHEKKGDIFIIDNVNFINYYSREINTFTGYFYFDDDKECPEYRR
jgi:hypothetical protein